MFWRKKRKKQTFAQRWVNLKIDFALRTQILFYNIIPLVIFELLFAFLISGSLFFIISWLLDSGIQIIGLDYITQDNFMDYVFNPLIILIAIFVILLLAFLCLFDICSTVFVFEISRQKIKTTLLDIIKQGFKNSMRLFKPNNLLLIPIVLVLFPLMSLGTRSIVTSNFEIPSTLIDSVTSSFASTIIFTIIAIILLYFATRCIFVVPYFVIEKCNLKTAFIKSWRILRGNYIKNIISVIIVQFIIFLSNYLLNLLAENLSMFAIDLFGHGSLFSSIAVGILIVVFYIIYTLLQGFFMPLSCWRICTLLYENKKIGQEEIVNYSYSPKKRKRHKLKIPIIIASTIFALVVIISSASVYLLSNNIISNVLDQGNKTKVVAYKNFSVATPSYSIATINQATEIGADAVYQDIYLTKDKQWITYSFIGVVRGSGNFDSNINDYTLEEIQNFVPNNTGKKIENMTNSDWTSTLKQITGNDNANLNSYSKNELQVPKLQDYLAAAKNSQKEIFLNIATEDINNEDLDVLINSIKNNYDFEHVSVCCINQDVLKYLKSKDSNICTVLRTLIAAGDFSDCNFANSIAVDSFNATDYQVQKFHDANKKVYVWNVSDKENISETVNNKCDYIITRKVKDAVEITERKAAPKFLSDILNKI